MGQNLKSEFEILNPGKPGNITSALK